LTIQIAKKQARTASKYAIAKYTQVFSSSNSTASQRTKTIYFFIAPVPVDPPQYYWPLLQVSRILYCLNKRSQTRHNLFSNILEVPAKNFKIPQDSHCRIVAISIG